MCAFGVDVSDDCALRVVAIARGDAKLRSDRRHRAIGCDQQARAQASAIGKHRGNTIGLVFDRSDLSRT